jgi:spore germination protein YaaH
VVPSISDGMPAGGMAAVLADPAQRAAHVDAVVALVRDNGFDGIDIDYEQFAFADTRSTWESTRPNWVAFITELADALHANGKVLTVSIPPIYDTDRTADSGYWVYDYAAIGEVVDRIRIMGYDYSVGEAGPIAPYDWVQSAVQAAKKAVDDDTKLVLGIGMYGRNWVVGTTGTCPASAEGTAPVTLRGVEELAAKRSATPVHDPVTQEAEFTYQLEVNDGTSACTQTRQVHYIDEQGVRARIDLAREERIGGVALWALGFDSEAVWPVIAPVARPQANDAAATTTAPSE